MTPLTLPHPTPTLPALTPAALLLLVDTPLWTWVAPATPQVMDPPAAHPSHMSERTPASHTSEQSKSIVTGKRLAAERNSLCRNTTPIEALYEQGEESRAGVAWQGNRGTGNLGSQGGSLIT